MSLMNRMSRSAAAGRFAAAARARRVRPTTSRLRMQQVRTAKARRSTKKHSEETIA
jgi:hypothetical protein